MDIYAAFVTFHRFPDRPFYNSLLEIILLPSAIETTEGKYIHRGLFRSAL
jgi:biotin synthase-related radical SAM superfamily protein